MKHSVPQFIDIEDKIIGPLGFKQAIYLAGSFGASFALFSILGKFDFELPTNVKIILSAPPMALGASLAFLKINKRKFIFYIEAAFKYFINPKKFVWLKQKKQVEKRGHSQRTNELEGTINVNPQYVPRVTKSKIKDLALSLDMELDENLDKIM